MSETEMVLQTPVLVPSTMTEAIKLAELMAGARLVPAALQKSPADCLMVIQQAIRWQMDPFAVAQECSVIQGKLMHSGKLVAAVVNARGNLSHRLNFDYSGQGAERTIKVSGTLRGEKSPRTITVELKKARTANKVWDSQPDQQLMYHGTRVWARRHAPELMLGVYSPEEYDPVGTDTDADLADMAPPESQWFSEIKRWFSEINKQTTPEAMHVWGINNSTAVANEPPEVKSAVYKHFRERLEMLENFAAAKADEKAELGVESARDFAEPDDAVDPAAVAFAKGPPNKRQE
jgi:hypothetical protein